MNKIYQIIKDKPKKITIKNSVEIINTSNNTYVIKKKTNKNLDYIYDYLISRSFDYFPKRLIKDNEYDIYEYVEGVKIPNEQKILDLVNLLTLLHNKTTFYKEIDIDIYKNIYEDVISRIEYLNNYYNNLMDTIESTIYMSPSEYLIASNISLIYNSLNYSRYQIDRWYNLIKDKRKIRLVNIHNNLNIDHFIKKDKPYFISWDKSKIDMPIYDILNLYKNHYLDFEFMDILKFYESKYPLLPEERLLLFVLMALPDEIDMTKSEYNTCIKVRKLLDYLAKTEYLTTEYSKETKTDEPNKFKE